MLENKFRNSAGMKAEVNVLRGPANVTDLVKETDISISGISQPRFFKFTLNEHNQVVVFTKRFEDQQFSDEPFTMWPNPSTR